MCEFIKINRDSRFLLLATVIMIVTALLLSVFSTTLGQATI